MRSLSKVPLSSTVAFLQNTWNNLLKDLLVIAVLVFPVGRGPAGVLTGSGWAESAAEAAWGQRAQAGGDGGVSAGEGAGAAETAVAHQQAAGGGAGPKISSTVAFIAQCHTQQHPNQLCTGYLEGHRDTFRLCLQVSGKLIDKEQILEEEIQLRERIQLQCKQAERMVEDLKMELHTTNQAKDELAKQVKVAQVRFYSTG